MKYALTLIAVVAYATSAQASTVSFSLLVNEDGPGTFNLYATSSAGDNFGIASFGAPLTGGILTVDHLSPSSLDGVSGSDVGFRLLRTADNNTFVSGSQNTVVPTPHIIYGFGQTGGDLAAAPGVTALVGVLTEQQVYGSPLLLASGTWDGVSLPGFDESSVDLGANVFLTNTDLSNEIASIETSVAIIPEPSSVLMAAMAGLAMLAMVRRRRARR